jgi:hypothetical protein
MGKDRSSERHEIADITLTVDTSNSLQTEIEDRVASFR